MTRPVHILLVLVLAGCFDDDWCGADEMYDDGIVCRPAAEGDDAGPAPAAPDSGGAIAATTAPGVPLGGECPRSAVCDVAADTCIVLPGQSVGYCAPSGCDVAVQDCPDGFICLDVRGFTDFRDSLCIRAGT